MGQIREKSVRASALLLLLSGVICAKGSSHKLHCVNDYVSTINCTLESDLPTDVHPWLKLKEKQDTEPELVCRLSRVADRFFCSVEYDVFVDTDTYRISLCRGTGGCELLEEGYRPVHNIKPKPPGHLALEQNSNQHHFSWKSSYEDALDYTNLGNELTYQLRFHQKGRFKEHQNVNTDQRTFSVPNNTFEPDSEYAAMVRSCPKSHYKGQWSDWSPQLHWRTRPREGSSLYPSEPPMVAKARKNPYMFEKKKLLVLVCLLVPFLLSLCYASVKRWRRVQIPTPEPYFSALYTDCNGDFKRWSIMEKTVDLPVTEKTNRIDKIMECEDVAAVDLHLPTDSAYANLSGMTCAFPELGAGGAPGLDSATASCASTCLSPRSMSPAEGDSGCWLSSDWSLKQNNLWYCNNYCTLSTFQQSALATTCELPECDACTLMGQGTSRGNNQVFA